VRSFFTAIKSGLLAGTADPHLPDGESGKVSVVQVGPLGELGSSATLPFAFRNNSGEGISHVDWAATAHSGGSIVATGSSQGTIPAQVQPGEIGLAFIFFDGNSKLLDGAAAGVQSWSAHIASNAGRLTQGESACGSRVLTSAIATAAID
jgi:hypothetical protein